MHNYSLFTLQTKGQSLHTMSGTVKAPIGGKTFNSTNNKTQIAIQSQSE